MKYFKYCRRFQKFAFDKIRIESRRDILDTNNVNSATSSL